MINILVIDDYPLIRTGIRMLLKNHFGQFQLYEASGLDTGASILQAEKDVQLVISEIKFNGKVTSTITDKLKSANPRVSVLLNSGLAERLYALPLMRAGADGFIMKRAHPNELTRAISIIVSGGKYMSAELQTAYLPGLVDKRSSKQFESLGKLSSREYLVMNQLMQGKCTKDIAYTLSLKSNTISTYKKRIYQKMNVVDQFDLLQKAADL